eukprot:TRINITY_DN22814_c0_g1_i1.p1 TRINITY_DN22814_c0_g1~~TRINITY_DN22814_c0_g1_i1.p1  ORF type:complete len:217 (-),score=61.64 TRINITY_DN22814_c0_g1_i1:171-755(-)
MAVAPRRSGKAFMPVLALALLTYAAYTWSSLAVPEASYRPLAPQPSFVNGLSMSRQALPKSHRIVMQSEKVDKLVESLKELTLLEASELVKAIEETFGVDASASGGAVMMAAPAAAAEEDAVEAKTAFDVILQEVPKDKKIAILKVIRNLTGLGLKEAKGMVDNPGKVMEGKPKEACEDAKKQLEEAGAKVSIE